MSARIVIDEGYESDEVRSFANVVVHPGVAVSVHLDYPPSGGATALRMLERAVAEARRGVEANP